MEQEVMYHLALESLAKLDKEDVHRDTGEIEQAKAGREARKD
jgi:hypothetical protein